MMGEGKVDLLAISPVNIQTRDNGIRISQFAKLNEIMAWYHDKGLAVWDLRKNGIIKFCEHIIILKKNLEFFLYL